jgi:hypothetical protein
VNVLGLQLEEARASKAGCSRARNASNGRSPVVTCTRRPATSSDHARACSRISFKLAKMRPQKKLSRSAERRAPAGPGAGQPDPEETVRRSQPWAVALPLIDELLAERGVLKKQVAAVSEGVTKLKDQGGEKANMTPL